MSYNCPHCKDRGAHTYERQHSYNSEPVTVHERCHCQPDIPSEREYYIAQKHCDEISVYGTPREMTEYLAQLHPYLQQRFEQMYGAKQ